MALVLKDRVKETSVTVGTGNIVLDGAVGPYQAFSTIGNGNTTYYAIAGQTTSEWEVGYGTYNSSGNYISRDVVLASSNSNTIVTFTAGTKDVFITYPAERAIYEEQNGDTVFNDGPITLFGPTTNQTVTPFTNTLARFYGNDDNFQQVYVQNQTDGGDASADFVAYNNLGDGNTYFIDMGINGPSFSSSSYPLFTENSGYLFTGGDTGVDADLFVGTSTGGDIIFFTNGVLTSDIKARIKSTTGNFLLGSNTDDGVNKLQVTGSAKVTGDAAVTGALTVTGAAYSSAAITVGNQLATKAYVDTTAQAGLDIHTAVQSDSDGNLSATYVDGGTTPTWTTITTNNTLTTGSAHGLAVDDVIVFGSTTNGLTAGTAYFVYSVPSSTQITLSLSYEGTQITTLTNGTGLSITSRANAGVGATLTSTTNGPFVSEGYTAVLNDRVLVHGQTTAAQNGVYTITQVGVAGGGGSPWIMTRSSDTNKYAPGSNGLDAGSYFLVTQGTDAGESYVNTNDTVIIFGTTAITFAEFSIPVQYTGTSPINVSGTTISLGTVGVANGGTNITTYTTGDMLYASAANTLSKLAKGSAYQSLVMDGSGTNVQWNSVNLSSSNAITGTLPATYGGTGQTTYATGDTLYSSASNTISILPGNTSTTKQFLSQTGTGSVSQAPSWASLSASDIQSGTLGATRGGTGQSSYTVGDLLYADTTTSLAKLADVATGNVLISGGLSTAPAWGKVALASAVSGTLGVANGGTGTTTSTGSGNVVLSTSPTLVTPALGTPSSGTLTSCTGLPLTTGVTGTLPIGNGGTGQTTANAAFNALAPSQSTNSGKYLTTNGSDTSWATVTQTTISFGSTGLTPSTATSGAVTVAGTLAVANGGTGATTATGSGSVVLATSPTLVTPALGTPSSGNFSSGTFTWPTFNQNTTGSAASVSGSSSNGYGTRTVSTAAPSGGADGDIWYKTS
jgi:hypothetical protein